MSDFFMYWKSKSSGQLVCWENQAKTLPLDCTNKPLMLIAKKKISDTDDEAIFTLTLGNGLTLEEEGTIDPRTNQISHNIISYVIPSAETAELPRTKDTTLHCELLVDPDGEDRQTIQELPLPVRASVKD